MTIVPSMDSPEMSSFTGLVIIPAFKSQWIRY